MSSPKESDAAAPTLTSVGAAAVSMDRGALVSAHVGGEIVVWRAHPLKAGKHIKPSGGLSRLAWSTDGKMVATGGPTKAPVEVFDATSGKRIASIAGPGGRVDGLSFSRDGHLLAIAGASPAPPAPGDKPKLRRYLDATIQVYSWPAAAVALPVAVWIVGRGAIAGLVARKGTSGNQFAALSEDGNLSIWDAASGARVALVKLGERGQSLVVGDDGRLVAGVDDGVLIVSESGKPQGSPVAVVDHLRHVDLSPDGSAVAVTGNDEVLVVTPSGTRRYPCREEDGTLSPEASFFMSSAHELAIVGGRSFVLRIFDVSSGKLIEQVKTGK